MMPFLIVLQKPFAFASFQNFRAFFHSIIIFFLLPNYSLKAQEVCPPISEIQLSFEQREAALTSLNTDLEKLQKGEIVKASAPGLFIVDLENAEAIEARIFEINKFLSANMEKSPNERYLNCIENNADLLSKLEDIQALDVEINKKRLTFLSLTAERRRALLDIQSQANQNEDLLKKIELKKQEAVKQADLANQAMREAESQIQLAGTVELRNLAAAKAILENTRRGIAEITFEWSKERGKAAEEAAEYTETLSQDASVLSQAKTEDEELLSAYSDVSARWRTLTDVVLSSFSKLDEMETNLPELPKIDLDLTKRLKEEVAYKEYAKALEAAIIERKQALELKQQFESDRSGDHFRLLLLAGRVRAQFIKELVARKNLSVFTINNDAIADFFREIRLIPYRPLVFAKAEIREAKHLSSEGIAGYITLLKRLLLLLAFFIVPVIAFKLLRKASERADQLRGWLVKSRHTMNKGPLIALWVKRLNPYLFWLSLFIATRLAAAVVGGTDLADIAELLPYFEYYFLYKIFKLVVENVLQSTGRYVSDAPAYLEITRLGSKTAKYLGLYFLTAAYLLKATQSVARTGLIYHLVWSIFSWITPVLFFLIAYRWRIEIGQLIERQLPNHFGGRLKNWCSSKKIAIFLSFPIFILATSVITVRWLFHLASRFDSAKSISAQIFRRKIESAAKTSGAVSHESRQKLSESYLSHFDLNGLADIDLLVETESFPVNEVLASIHDWRDDLHERHTIAIHGVKGAGKSSYCQRLISELRDVDVKYSVVTNKIVESSSLLDYIGQILGVGSLSDESELLILDEKIGKTVVLIDDGQNFFLAKRNGFEAFNMLTRLLNIGTKNIFWSVIFNRYSWSYLNAVTGGSEYFRAVYSINRWNDRDIRDLILKRHAKAGFELEFDPLIFAAESHRENEGTAYIKDKFFELLWEQSKGNPRTAIVFWLESLKPIENSKLLVGLPPIPPAQPLAGLTDDEIFVIAAVIRHENLTTLEAQNVTSLPDSVVRHALRIGIERKFLERSTEGRYRIRPKWQAPLTNQLISKNFVYE